MILIKPIIQKDFSPIYIIYNYKYNQIIFILAITSQRFAKVDDPEDLYETMQNYEPPSTPPAVHTNNSTPPLYLSLMRRLSSVPKSPLSSPGKCSDPADIFVALMKHFKTL